MSQLLHLTSLAASSAKQHILDALRINADDIVARWTLELITAEYIRTWLTPAAAIDNDSQVVSRSVLLLRVRSQLGDFLESIAVAPADLIDRVFRRLRLMREIVTLPTGFVQMAPFRVVLVPGQYSLLIGGGDCQSLCSHIGLQPHFSSFARSIHCDEVTRVVETDGNRISKQDLHAWSGLPRVGLAAWLQFLIERGRNAAVPGGGWEDASVVYLPRFDKTRRRVTRWLPLSATDRHAGEPLLVLHKAPRPQYYLVWTRNRGASKSIASQYHLSRDEALRAQFCIDQQFNLCDTLTVTKHGDRCHMTLRRRLPLAQERILAALCLQQDAESPNERVFEFHSNWLPAIELTFRELQWNFEIANSSGAMQ